MTSAPSGWKGSSTSPPNEPTDQLGQRTSSARYLANTLTAQRFTLLWIVLALLAGVGLGNLIGSPTSARFPAPGQPDSSIHSPAAARTAATTAGGGVLAAVSAAPPQTERANPDVPLEMSKAIDFADADAFQTIIDARAGTTASPDDAVEAQPVRGVDPAPTAASRYAAIPIESLPMHRPEPSTLQVRPKSNGSKTPTGAYTIVTRGEIAEGESLGSSLGRQGISPSTVHLIDREMRKIFDFRHARPGDRYRLGQDSEGRVLDFRYSQNPEESYYLAWEGSRYAVRKETAELHAQVAKIAGVVDSSFYSAIVALGEQSALASEFARIFAWDIDFSRNVHPGDEFSILYERLYRRNPDGEEVYVRPGRILAGRYAGKTGPHTIVYFEDDEQGGAYFRPDGSSVERAFLAAPLEFSRISSRFTRARHHPILNVTRPHPGIDYAAPHGTPVYAVAEGVVEYKARAGASGNLVRIRHAGGYTSHYAHLSGFEKSLEVGDRVQQREVIGYVGSSGLSTGPHVCFRVKKDGRYVDPMKISSPPGQPIERAHLAQFKHVRDQLLANLGPAPVNLADEAL